MAMEIHVLFHGKLPSKAALTRAMRELGFPCTIGGKGSLDRQNGYMPMRVRRQESGVEFDVFEGRASVEEMAGANTDARFDRSANFRWSGDEDEMLAALCTPAALAKRIDGIVLNEWDDGAVTPDEAIAYARKELAAARKPAGRPRGTRPADIKHYLKSLLEQRSDLVLVERMLVVRPVRHVLRGAFLDRMSNKYCLEVWRYLRPLYMPVPGFGGGDDRCIRFEVWQPHFQPLVIDRLAEDIFAQTGRTTTLEDFAASMSGRRDRVLTHITSLVLAGKRDLAAERVQAITRGELFGHRKREVQAHWELLNRDIDVVCAEFHAMEAETIKVLKLEHIWEPSPFPVEVAAGERSHCTDEPAFPLSPWVPRPPDLLQELPERPGEVRFAKDLLHRHGVTFLVAALTREQAEERHRQFEPYILVVVLPGGFRLTISRYGGRDREDPQRLETVEHMRRTTGREQPDTWPLYPSGEPPWMRLHVALKGASHLLTATASEFRLRPGLMEFQPLEVYAPGVRYSSWYCWFDREKGEKTIHDWRTSPKTYTVAALTPTERDLLTFATPAFGEYDALVTRLRALLQAAGFNEFG